MLNAGPVIATYAVSADEVWFSEELIPEFHYAQFRSGAFAEGSLNGFDALSITSDTHGVVMAGADSFFGASNGRIFRFDAGLTWDGANTLFTGAFRDVDALDFRAVFNAGSQTWAATGRGVANAHLLVAEGSTWTADASAQLPEAADGGVTEFFTGWGSADGDFWVSAIAGRTKHSFHHFSRGTWHSFAVPATLFAISGSSSGDVWAAGANGLILRSDGGTPTQVEVDAGVGVTWFGAFAPAATDVFIVGGDSTHGVVAHWNGVAFDFTTVGSSALQSIHGTSSTNLWAGDSKGGLWHFGP